MDQCDFYELIWNRDLTLDPSYNSDSISSFHSWLWSLAIVIAMALAMVFGSLVCAIQKFSN
jgi:hypothetical protein